MHIYPWCLARVHWRLHRPTAGLTEPNCSIGSWHLWVKAATDPSFLFLKLIRSVRFSSVIPEKKNWWNCFSKLAQYNMEFAGSVVNQAKADPDKDKENNRTLSGSWLAASPNCRRNLLICSIVETSPFPENLVKSGILYCVGEQSDHKSKDRESCTCKSSKFMHALHSMFLWLPFSSNIAPWALV